MPSRGFWIKLGLFAVKLAVIFALVAYASGSRGNTVYQTATVTRSTLSLSVSALGTLEPTSRVEVGVEISGLVRTVLADVNDTVQVGQRLALLDTEQFQIQQQQAAANRMIAEGELLEARAGYQDAQSRHARLAQLSGQGHAARQEIDAAQAALDRARARVLSAEGRVQLADAAVRAEKLKVDRAAIVSPIDGFVLERRVQPGQTVTSTFQTPVLFVLARDLREMYLRAEIAEADIGKVEVGQRATFRVDAHPGRVFEATIWRIVNSPSGRSSLVTYEATLLVRNDDLALRPGMTASVDIIVDQVEDAVSVPNEALRFRPSDRRDLPVAGSQGSQSALLWIPGEDGRPAPVEVKLGPTDGFRTAVLSGLTPEAALTVIVAETRR